MRAVRRMRATRFYAAEAGSLDGVLNHVELLVGAAEVEP